ncbi:MAG: homoserine kinase [Tepidamorphaceae bacterium]|nr:homoserine kinase [Rhodobiaceae bacterium]MCC0048960.1 homoserine kinase [Rhodobiaceae bacterium]
MAVYTDVSDEEIESFIAAYDIGGLMSFKGIAEGVENSNYLVHTESGQFILTLYEKRVAEEDLPYFLELMEHLAERGIRCPQPIHGRDGKVLRKLAGRPAALIEFLEGMWVRRPRMEHCRELGTTLAKFHLAGADYSGHRKNALSVSGWRPIFEAAKADADSVAPGLAREMEEELQAFERGWPSGLPEGVIHADLFPDNVFFLGEKLSGLIDFYFACNDAFAYDVAICLNAWCFEPDLSFNVTKARALMTAYTEVRRFSDEEIAALPMLARGASMRFLVTRLYDWLNTPAGALVRPKDPMEYLRRMRFHRTVTSATQYGLEA